MYNTCMYVIRASTNGYYEPTNEKPEGDIRRVESAALSAISGSSHDKKIPHGVHCGVHGDSRSTTPQGLSWHFHFSINLLCFNFPITPPISVPYPMLITL